MEFASKIKSKYWQMKQYLKINEEYLLAATSEIQLIFIIFFKFIYTSYMVKVYAQLLFYY